VALTFFDYWYPELAGVTSPGDLQEKHWDRLAKVEYELGAKVSILGTGPQSVIVL